MNTFHPFTLVAIGAIVALLCVAYPGLFFLLLAGVLLSIIGAALDRLALSWRLHKAQRFGKEP